MDSTDDSNKNFFKHVFNFDEDSKADMLNIIQYAMISIIPVVLLNKSIQRYVPEADDQKGSLEVLAEIIIQVIVMFTGLMLVHRMATFLPTYSGVKYPEFSIIFIILAVLMIALSLQTKLGEKVSILTDRVTEMWEGKSDDKKKKGNVKVSQPISQNGQNQAAMNQAAMNQAIYSDGTSINSLPSNETQQLPNYDAMHRPDTTPLVNAATPSMEGSYMEPMAANSALGGFGGFSAW